MLWWIIIFRVSQYLLKVKFEAMWQNVNCLKQKGQKLSARLQLKSAGPPLHDDESWWFPPAPPWGLCNKKITLKLSRMKPAHAGLCHELHLSSSSTRQRDCRSPSAGWGSGRRSPPSRCLGPRGRAASWSLSCKPPPPPETQPTLRQNRQQRGTGILKTSCHISLTSESGDTEDELLQADQSETCRDVTGQSIMRRDTVDSPAFHAEHRHVVLTLNNN